MMKTRRKSKAATAAASEQEAEPRSSPVHDEGAHSLSIALPDDLDHDTLLNLFPDVNISSPSAEDILALYRLLVGQASDLDASQRELDEARADAERKDVELDQALQDRESMSKDLEASLEEIRDELTQVKQERDQLGEAKAALQAQVTALSNSQSSSSSEVDTLKHRVDDTEREKRDLVGVISRLKEEGTQREEEIQSLRANLKEARQEHQALEAQVRELRSTETSTKFKLDSLAQQLQLSQGEADRSNAELTSKTEEFAKYRRTKHAEMTHIQASYDALTQTHASTQASLKSLQSAHTAQTHQLTQALAKVQDLTGQLAEQEARYSSEANGLRRLVSMMEEREKQAKEIVESIESEWAGVGERAERRESALKDEIEKEKRGRELAEKRVEQLETVMDRMGRGELPMPGRSTPGTPMRTPGGGDPITDGMMGLSPTVAMASKAQRTGKTFTEVYADYVRLQEDYARKSAEYDHMDRTLAAVLAQIEERAPILSQQRSEYERLQSEASQLASQLAQALAERDAQANLYQESSQKLSKSTNENSMLQQQLEDLGRQVQSLLRDIARRDDPTIPSDEDLENIATINPAEDADSLITDHLVVFKSIGGLQDQNQKLLKIVRQLAQKMENDEREYKDAMEKEQAEAIREAHEAMQELAAQLERQKKHSDGVIHAYVKERDALRSMLARAEKATGQPLTKGINGDRSGEASHAGDSELVRELTEVQNQFEAYRTEMGVDSNKLRDELIRAQREVSSLEATLAKSNAKIEYLSDRHRMHQEQFALHGREVDDLSKRNQHLYDQWTRIDIECSRVTEDLQVANGRVEQLRNECANLRAEKKIWESVQSRLVEENKTLALERSHLSDLMTNVQKMHVDLERSGENDRRRLESQLQMLDSQTQDLRTQVTQERDTVRHISLQKEIELKELQGRLEKSAEELSRTRESLVSAETSKKHLEERVDELNRQLRGNEEKLAVYERRSSTVAGVSQTVDQNLSREQQLEAEVADLRSALKVAEVDLAAARSHVQQFQEISRANEEALSNVNSTYEEYKTSTEAQIIRHESEYNALQEKFQSAQNELAELNSKYNDLQKAFDTERTAWTNDKKTLEDTIVDMSTSEKHSESDRSSRETELRQLEDRAKVAEERYSHEVIAHAESMKSIEGLKRDLSSAQAMARDNLTSAETAQAKLSASESSWKQQKDALDKEVSDLNARCRDLSSQNAILHQHLESVSNQAARIKQAADSSSSTVPGDAESTENSDAKLSELRQVVAYLRKEKEIVDLQLELGKQENARLKAQTEHLAQTLQETRNTLSEERERAVESAASAAQHAELLDRINQLNILRESNATLRAECESSAKKSRELETKLKQLSEELDPAKEQARMAEAELQASKKQLERLEQESRRWQERNSQLLSKYDRIDPADVQALKDEIERLKVQQVTEGETTQQKTEEQSKKIENLEISITRQKEQAVKNHNIFKQRMAELRIATEEKTKLEARVAELEAEINQLQAAKTAAEQQAAVTSSEEASQQAATIESLREERDKLLAEKEARVSPSTDGSAPSTWETEKDELVKARDEALEKLQTVTQEAEKAAQEIKDVKAQNNKAIARIRSLMEMRANEAQRATALRETAVSEAIEKMKAELQNAPSSSASQEEIVAKHAEQLKAVQEELKAKHEEELKSVVDAAVQAAVKNRPEAPSEDEKKVSETNHAEEIAAAVERGRMELSSKLKVKDSQLVKAQARVKALEGQIVEWKKKGIIPADAPPSAPATGAAAPTTATPASDAHTNAAASTSGAAAPHPPAGTPTAPKAPHAAASPALTKATAAATGGAANLPRKPSLLTPGAPATRGGHVERGGPAGRGGLVRRGGAPLRVPPTKPTAPTAAAAAATAQAATPTAPAAGGMSIMGAAAKRPREETPAEDSLAKRLKPTEGAGKPVTLRRPPPPT